LYFYRIREKLGWLGGIFALQVRTFSPAGKKNLTIAASCIRKSPFKIVTLSLQGWV
jgi:hypothetical protein